MAGTAPHPLRGGTTRGVGAGTGRDGQDGGDCRLRRGSFALAAQQALSSMMKWILRASRSQPAPTSK
eukprot:scaffold2854_cov116-Isochrysis_galbana.AAC.3